MNSNACGSSSPILSPPISPSNVVPEEPLGFHNVFALLKVFAQHNLRQEERWLHTLICCLAYDIHIFVSNAVIELYARCHLVLEAKATFDATPFPNQYTWNHLLVAYGQNGLAVEAHRVFQRLPARNVVSWNALIAAYVKNGHPLYALHVFSCMHTEG
ncbi:hypothetical protein KP509_15G077400 [Ceratopteris richardii]|uniref:Pentatricopeptide repeat-containing protein n=1 Tax=Ceratopteris richardii TaxID=49495 RepID=A0A8T2T792_CERRI|nr:hypothetical protein KP509_15G077400 [Ceratopteris richardii]